MNIIYSEINFQGGLEQPLRMLLINCHRADFNESETDFMQSMYCSAISIKPCRQSDWIIECIAAFS